MKLVKSHFFLIFHVIFVFFLFIVNGGFLVLLILRYQIIHIRLCFSEFHLIHTLSSVPMEKSFSSEHSCKLLSDSFEHFLYCSRVTDESCSHLQSIWWDITDRGLDIVRNPFNKVRRIFILYIKHLLIYFFGRYSSSEHGRGSQVSTVSWVRGTHHILSIKHLLSKFRYI